MNTSILDTCEYAAELASVDSDSDIEGPWSSANLIGTPETGGL